MTDCIFCNIIEGKVPCNKVYGDEDVLAFLDIEPATKGHTLIIPKTHVENLYRIEEDILSKIHRVSKQLARHYKQVLDCDGVNIIQSNEKAAHQDVMHYHVHLIPRYEDDGKSVWDELKKDDVDIDLEQLSEDIKLIHYDKH